MRKPPAISRIVHTPGVAGGSARVDGTRIPVWLLASWSRAGWTTEHIRDEYAVAGLTDDDIDAALAYAAAHPDEIEHELAEQRRD